MSLFLLPLLFIIIFTIILSFSKMTNQKNSIVTTLLLALAVGLTIIILLLPAIAISQRG